MPAARGQWLAPLAVLASFCGASSEAELGSFSVYTDTAWLRPGQVHNAWRTPQRLPEEVLRRFAGRRMLIKAINIDIVRICNVTGKEISLPLTEIYNHHFATMFGPLDDLQDLYQRENGSDPLGPHTARKLAHHGCMMQGAAINALLEEVRASGHHDIAAFGGASGAEFRGTPTALPTPYAFAMNITENFAFMALLHFIDMHGASDVGHRRFECPCTKARRFDLENGTIDGMRPVPFTCSEELIKQGNPSCSLATYQGGYRCCENGVFLTDKIPGPLARRHPFKAKLTVTYYEDLPNPKLAKHVDCCDASGNQTVKGNLEYDVPQCAPGTPPHLCEHIATSVQPLNLQVGGDRLSNHSRGPPRDPDQLLDLVHAWGHQHVGSLGMELWNEQTGQLLCRTQPRIGTGSEAGNEAGFLVGIPPCVWGPPPLLPPPRLRQGDLLRTVARYNSSIARRGVMSLWLMEAAEVRADQPDFLV